MAVFVVSGAGCDVYCIATTEILGIMLLPLLLMAVIGKFHC